MTDSYGKIHVGDVSVFIGQVPYPFAQPSLIGDVRRALLRAWKNGEIRDNSVDFWCTRSGDIRRIDRLEVNWSTSGIWL